MAHISKARFGQGWEARYRAPHGEERSRTFRTKRDAQQFVARAESDLQRGEWLDPRVGRIRFEEWAREWLATSVHLKPRTRYGYERLLEGEVLPVFGQQRIASIERVDIRPGSSPTSRRQARRRALCATPSRSSATSSTSPSTPVQ